MYTKIRKRLHGYNTKIHQCINAGMQECRNEKRCQTCQHFPGSTSSEAGTSDFFSFVLAFVFVFVLVFFFTPGLDVDGVGVLVLDLVVVIVVVVPVSLVVVEVVVGGLTVVFSVSDEGDGEGGLV